MANPTPEHQVTIVPAHRPGFVRRPDVAVVTRAGIARRRAEGGVLRASELVIANELVSVGSERTDHVIKRGEYADAGVPHYWIVEIDDRPTLIAHHLAGGWGYVGAPPATGTFTTDQPFAVRVDLDQLR